MTKITVTLAALLLAGGVAFAQSSGTGSAAGGTGTSTSSMQKSGASASKLTGCKTTASKEEKGKQGAVANSSSHNAATTGSRASNGSAKTGC